MVSPQQDPWLTTGCTRADGMWSIECSTEQHSFLAWVADIRHMDNAKLKITEGGTDEK